MPQQRSKILCAATKTWRSQINTHILKKKKEKKRKESQYRWNVILALLLSSSSWRKEAQRKENTCTRAHRKCWRQDLKIWIPLDPGILFFSSRIQVLAMFTNLNRDLEPDWSLKMGLHSRWDLNRLPLHQSHWCQCLPTLTQKMYIMLRSMLCAWTATGWGGG